ncbi:unnamed protein product [Mytilus coruscus]|uniref:ZMYM2-like/QRICH1 C-terminal domain-containing protein n=1 Tax=Mytilus coruscus TaxID=42192 RepID=A0A6J8BPG7_MYTCO|nr:unnamed protein product [Mytilus coruscus]
MMYSVSKFKQFSNDIKSKTRDIYTIQPTELDTYLQDFFLGIRKQTKNENDESEYQPGTLSGFHGMINRYISLNGYTHDIMKDLTFKKSRDCLMAMKKHLKELGLGNLPNAAEAIESDEEEKLFSSGAFGTGNPDSLLAAIWYLNTIHFGLRGSPEHRQLKWGDVTIGTEPNGTKKITYNERLTKTRDGTNSKNTRAYVPKSWNDNHINMYLEYKSHRPPDMCSPESPFTWELTDL